MNTMNLLGHLHNGVMPENWKLVKTPEEGDCVSFARKHFGGEYVAGTLNPGRNYIAFWAQFPEYIEYIADAVVTDAQGNYVRIYEVE